MSWVKALDPENTPLLSGTMENVVLALCGDHSKVGPMHGLVVKHFKKFKHLTAPEGFGPGEEM